jgi:hypothetical protein
VALATRNVAVESSLGPPSFFASSFVAYGDRTRHKKTARAAPDCLSMIIPPPGFFHSEIRLFRPVWRGEMRSAATVVPDGAHHRSEDDHGSDGDEPGHEGEQGTDGPAGLVSEMIVEEK